MQYLIASIYDKQFHVQIIIHAVIKDKDYIADTAKY